MAGSARDALPGSWDWWAGPFRGLGVVRRPSQRDGSCRGPSRTIRNHCRRTGSGWEALPKGREWFAGTPGGPGVVGRASWWARICRKALPEDREWS